MKSLRTASALVSLTMALRSVGTAATVTPLFDFRFFGGQIFSDGKPSSLTGNLNLVASPAVKFNDRWSLLPTYMGEYRGTRDVQELAGGGTLFQDSMGHGLGIKGIYSPSSSWKIRPSAGARVELLRETKDEKWGKGLFDYRKFSGGFEVEKAFAKSKGTRLSYDYFVLKFPNYKSLESSQDDTLSRELAGKYVLDSGNHLFSGGFWHPFPGKVKLDFSAFYNLRSFDDQPVVVASGGLSSAKREDKVMSLSAGISRPWSVFEDGLRLVGELGLSYGATTSNQNHYDARKAVFQEKYYDYDEISFSPRVTAALGDRPWVVSLGGSYKKRDYAHRPVQDENGNFLGGRTRLTEYSASLGLTYPAAENLKIRALSTMAWSDSNTDYEKVFKYNYKIANYLLGFSYEY